MRFRAKNGAIRKLIAPIRANQIARIKMDFKMDVINFDICEHISCRALNSPGTKDMKQNKKKLAWKNLKQKLKSCQVKVDRYKSELPDLQRL